MRLSFCAKVQLPPFTRGKKQLSKEEADGSQQLSQAVFMCKKLLWLLGKKTSFFNQH